MARKLKKTRFKTEGVTFIETTVNNLGDEGVRMVSETLKMNDMLKRLTLGGLNDVMNEIEVNV